MFAALLFLLTTTALGGLVVRWLPGVRGAGAGLGISLALGLLFQLWLPFVAARSFGMEAGPWVALLAAVVLTLALVSSMPEGGLGRVWDGWRKQCRQRNFRRNAGGMLLVSLLAGWMFYTHSLRPTPEGLVSAGVGWEDQSYHAMLASSFLWSDNLRALEYPHFRGWPLGYPFLADLLAAVMMRLGATPGQAFWLTAWYAGSAFFLLLWVLMRDWLGSGRWAWIAVVLAIFSGGAGFLDFFRELGNGLGWPEVLMRHDYTNGWELGLHYHNLVTGVLLPMRTSLFGMPLALAVLWMLPRLLGGAGGGWAEWIVTGMLMGLMPLIHAHSFLVLVWCGLGYALFFFRPQSGADWVRPLCGCLVPMLFFAWPQVMWTRGQMAISESFIRFFPGWMCEAKTWVGWVGYWLHNGGLRLPLGVVCWWFAPGPLRKKTAPLLLLLGLGNLVSFQPFAYDNIKLFAFADVALAALLILPLQAFWQRGSWGRGLAVLLLVVLTGSGFLSIWRETRLRSVICDWDAVTFAGMVRDTTPKRAVFLTSGELTHPVPVLTGRPLVLGYTGWLAQHGVRMENRPAEVREMFEGGVNALDLFRRYAVDYVVVGPSERREFPGLREDFLLEHSRTRFQSGPYTLYEMRRD